MRNKSLSFILMVSILGAILLLSACSSSKSATGNVVTATDTSVATGPVKDVTISVFNFGFNQEPVTIQKGDQVRLHITSTEGTHGIRIPDLGLSTTKLAPGEEQVLEFVANESGTFNYYCNVPCGAGHGSMRGQLVVD